MSVKDIITNHYKHRVSSEKSSYDILDWSSEEEQFIRFQVLADKLKDLSLPHGLSVLDVGCGLADLKYFLNNQFTGLHYTGTDLTFEVAREAVRRHSDASVICADLNCPFPFKPNTFDVVFASGVFNLRLDNHETFVLNAIKHMLDVAQTGILVNFLHKRITTKYDYCFYTSPEWVIEHCKDITTDIQVIDNYLEKDFSIWISK